MVKPVLKMLMSVDLFDIEEGGVPPDPESFSILVEALIGEEGPAADTFSVIVATPDQIASHIPESGQLSGRGYLIVRRYDYAAIRATIDGWVRESAAETWEQSAAQLCKHMLWEFDHGGP